MSEKSVILDLPYIQAAQAQKHVTHNEALRVLDLLVQLSVIDDGLTIAPTSPQDGDRYLVPAGASGIWAGYEGQIAVYENAAWLFHPPLVGWQVWVLAQENWVIYDGTTWNAFQPPHPSALADVSRFGLNATASIDTPFVATVPNALWQAVDPNEGGTGSVIQSMNRFGATTDAGIAWQTDYTTHGLLGFFGSDQLRLSTSTDGVNFKDAARIDPATGILSQPLRPRFKGTTNFNNPLPKDVWVKMTINTLSVNPQNAFDAASNLFTAPVDGTYILGGVAVFVKDGSNDVRLQLRMILNGSDEIDGSFAHSNANHTTNSSSVASETLVALSAGDTVELQARATRNAAFAMANRSAFWGYLLP